jgi:hypothetical protein
LAFTSFSKQEQQTILGWLADQEFENAGLDVAIEKKKTTKKTTFSNNEAGLCGEIDYITYDITLENRAEVPFKKISVFAEIFYQTQDGQEEKKSLVETTDWTIDLSPGEIRTLKTRTVSLRDERKVSPGITSVSGYSPGGGFSTSTSGGAPTIFYRDKLVGTTFHVSKKGQDGKRIKHKFEDGNPPDEEKQREYRISKPNPAPVSFAGTKKSTSDWTEEELQRRTIIAGRNSIGAVNLGEYYSKHGDVQKAKKWAAKAREMLEKLPPKQQEAVAKRIAALEELGENPPQE